METISASEVAQFKKSLRAAFGRDAGSEETRRLMSTAEAWDRRTWSRFASELELPGLMLPVEYGGSGMGALEAAYALEEAGAAALCAPLFSTAALAVPLLLSLGDKDALTRYGPPLCAGTTTATVALAEDDGRWDPRAVSTTAESTPDGDRLSGVKNYVVDGGTADLLLVVAREKGSSRVGVYAVSSDTEGLRREPLISLDQSRRLARMVLDSVPAIRIGPLDALTNIAEASDVSRVLLAAEQTGGAQRCVDMACDYARTRIQFGRPIGSFQAIKQRLADMVIKVESSRSAAYASARIATEGAAAGEPELCIAARIAALTAAEAFLFASAQNIQLHGGIGFTWEHDAHLYYKRARTSAQLLGTEGEHLDALAQAMEIANELRDEQHHESGD